MNILLIDDHAMLREALKFYLPELDSSIAVTTAGDDDTGPNTIGSGDPDVPTDLCLRPNRTRAGSTIEIDFPPTNGSPEVTVYDLSGRAVEIIDNVEMTALRATAEWTPGEHLSPTQSQ